MMMMPEDVLQSIIEATTQQAEKHLKLANLCAFAAFFTSNDLATNSGERRDLRRTESDGPFPAPALVLQ